MREDSNREPRTFSTGLRRHFRLAFADLRHFAEETSPPLDATLDDYLHDIEEIQAATGGRHVVLIGHSHHGTLAFEYAKRHPEAVSHLVLIGAPPAGLQAIARASGGNRTEGCVCRGIRG